MNDAGNKVVGEAAMSKEALPIEVEAGTAHGAPAYVTGWATSRRSSHVTVPMRKDLSITPVGPVGSDTGRTDEPQPSAFVLPFGEHVAIVHSGALSMIDGATGARSSWEKLGLGLDVCVSDSTVFVPYSGPGRAGVRKVEMFFDPPARIWAMRVEAGRVWLLRQEPPEVEYEGPRTEPRFAAHVASLRPEGDKRISADKHYFEGNELATASAMGAIFDNGDVAVATTDKRFFVYPDTTDDSQAEKARRPHRLAFAPYEISILAPNRIGLLEAVGVALDPNGEKGPYSIAQELFLEYPQRKGKWATALHVVDRKGQPVESVTVPFPVLQPPIDGEGGRTYLAGIGFAAVERGRVLYTHASKHMCLATAMLGGDVVLAMGEELRFIARDGTIRQIVRVAPGETIATPPAVGPDGAIWVATEKTLYVVR